MEGKEKRKREKQLKRRKSVNYNTLGGLNGQSGGKWMVTRKTPPA